MSIIVYMFYVLHNFNLKGALNYFYTIVGAEKMAKFKK